MQWAPLMVGSHDACVGLQPKKAKKDTTRKPNRHRITEAHIAALWSSPGWKILHNKLTTDILDTARFILPMRFEFLHMAIKN